MKQLLFSITHLKARLAHPDQRCAGPAQVCGCHSVLWGLLAMEMPMQIVKFEINFRIYLMKRFGISACLQLQGKKNSENLTQLVLFVSVSFVSNRPKSQLKKPNAPPTESFQGRVCQNSHKKPLTIV